MRMERHPPTYFGEELEFEENCQIILFSLEKTDARMITYRSKTGIASIGFPGSRSEILVSYFKQPNNGFTSYNIGYIKL